MKILPSDFSRKDALLPNSSIPKSLRYYDFWLARSLLLFFHGVSSEGTLAQQIERWTYFAAQSGLIKLIAEALAYAHKRGINSPRYQPQNILFRQDGTPVLSDSGIAKIVDADTQLTASGLTIGQSSLQ